MTFSQHEGSRGGDKEPHGLQENVQPLLLGGVGGGAALSSRGLSTSVPRTAFALPGALFRDATKKGTGQSGSEESNDGSRSGNTKTDIDDLMQKLDLTEEQIDHFRDCFNLFDKDGNGEVDVEELETALMSLGQT